MNNPKENIQKLLEIIKDHYIDADVALKVCSAVEEFMKSEIFKVILESGSGRRLITKINCILDNITNDGHFYINLKSEDYGNRQQTGVERYSPHFIKIRKFEYMGNENIRSAYMKIFEQVQDPLVIDLRDCPGGDPELVYFILCHLFANNTTLYEFHHRNNPKKVFKSVDKFPFYLTYNTVKKYTGRVRVLVNDRTASAGESLAFIVQKRGRGKIYGSNTAGHAHVTVSYTIGDFTVYLPSGKTVDPKTQESWEMKGVKPDFSIDSKEYISLIYDEVSLVNITPVE